MKELIGNFILWLVFSYLMGSWSALSEYKEARYDYRKMEFTTKQCYCFAGIFSAIVMVLMHAVIFAVELLRG